VTQGKATESRCVDKGDDGGISQYAQRELYEMEGGGSENVLQPNEVVEIRKTCRGKGKKGKDPLRGLKKMVKWRNQLKR